MDLDFITRYYGPRGKIAVFPKTKEIFTRNYNDRYIMEDHPFVQFFINNIDAKRIFDEVVKVSNYVEFEDIIRNFKSKDFLKKNRVKLGFSRLCSWDMEFDISLKIFKDVELEKVHFVNLHVEWIIMDINKGSFSEVCTIFMDGCLYGKIAFTNEKKDINPLWQKEWFAKREIGKLIKLIEDAAHQGKFYTFKVREKVESRVIRRVEKNVKRRDAIQEVCYSSIMDAYTEYMQYLNNEY